MTLLHALQVDSYLLTPLIKPTDGGQFAASVSIRRGATDRVFRLIPLFDDARRAARYAVEQGRLFIRNNQLA